MSKSGAFNKYLGFLWVTFQRPIGIPMANIEATHQISNGIHSTNPLDFQWPTTHWKSNGPLDIQWGIGNPMGHPIGFPMGAKDEIVNLWGDLKWHTILMVRELRKKGFCMMFS